MDSVYVIGSSIVRHVRVRDVNSRTTVSCFPGARVLDIAKRLLSALRRRDAFGTVVIHVGTNDISDRRSEVLKEHYQTLLDTARKKTDARIVISGPLPTYWRGSERFSKLFALQSWLRGWCACNGLGYVDNWSSFWEQPALYRRDGLHPSPLGF
uniref:SGNH hydrolase-type esterase domain-containing protein n=1 Tax=Pygocentrus nattereri TaxID=42514 RepID=A0A3B4DG23_PYGNA